MTTPVGHQILPCPCQWHKNMGKISPGISDFSPLTNSATQRRLYFLIDILKKKVLRHNTCQRKYFEIWTMMNHLESLLKFISWLSRAQTCSHIQMLVTKLNHHVVWDRKWSLPQKRDEVTKSYKTQPATSQSRNWTHSLELGLGTSFFLRWVCFECAVSWRCICITDACK